MGIAWYGLKEWLKAALINIFILTMDQITLCNVKSVAHNVEPTENYLPTLQLPSALRLLVHCFGFTAGKIKFKKSDKPTVCFLPSTTLMTKLMTSCWLKSQIFPSEVVKSKTEPKKSIRAVLRLDYGYRHGLRQARERLWFVCFLKNCLVREPSWSWLKEELLG